MIWRLTKRSIYRLMELPPCWAKVRFYVDRFVNRHIMSYEVPTAMFQSINAFAVMLCGMVLAWLVKESVNGNRTVRIWGKLRSGQYTG